MLLYTSKYLKIKIKKEDSLLVQYWVKSPLSIEEFKEEMLAYVAIYEKYKPSNSLWLQENFKLNLDTDAFNWIEEHVNVPCFNYGNKKLAFVVSKDALAHVDVINVFEETKSIINNQTKHFSSEKRARKWLTNTHNILDENNAKILFKGEDNDGNAILKLNGNTDIKEILLALKKIEKNEQLNKNRLLLKNGTIINSNEIIYIKSDGHYVEIFIKNKNKPEIVRSTLTEILSALPSSNFLRTHKSFIVNIHKIKKFNPNQLMLESGEWIKLSRTYKQQLKEMLN